MGWKVISYDTISQMPCACGKGRIVYGNCLEKDNWNRYRHAKHLVIACKHCRETHTLTYYEGSIYLVPNGAYFSRSEEHNQRILANSYKINL